MYSRNYFGDVLWTMLYRRSDYDHNGPSGLGIYESISLTASPSFTPPDSQSQVCPTWFCNWSYSLPTFASSCPPVPISFLRHLIYSVFLPPWTSVQVSCLSQCHFSLLTLIPYGTCLPWHSYWISVPISLPSFPWLLLQSVFSPSGSQSLCPTRQKLPTPHELPVPVILSSQPGLGKRIPDESNCLFFLGISRRGRVLFCFFPYTNYTLMLNFFPPLFPTVYFFAFLTS